VTDESDGGRGQSSSPRSIESRRLVQRSKNVNWLVHRVVISDEYGDPLPTVKRSWTAGDLADAHRVLDDVQREQKRQREEAQKSAEDYETPGSTPNTPSTSSPPSTPSF
jgi:hypothetical protein